MTAPPADRSVRARAPGKVNLLLRVGPRRPDGYHAVTSLFQAVSVYEDVVARHAEDLTVSVAGPQADRVPTDGTNLAVQAAAALAAYAGVRPRVHLHLVKGVPVAGGMGGGSADAAAALLACDALWDTRLSREQLSGLAAELGSDVPFALAGHTAVGTGHGDVLAPAMSRGEYAWVLAVQSTGLSTAAVYAAFDARGTVADPDPAADVAILQALRAGDAVGLGHALHNDLQPAALTLAPWLADVVAAAEDAGALGVVVSGSGPTVAALARNRQHALVLSAALVAGGVADHVIPVVGPVPGARILTGGQ